MSNEHVIDFYHSHMRRALRAHIARVAKLKLFRKWDRLYMRERYHTK